MAGLFQQSERARKGVIGWNAGCALRGSIAGFGKRGCVRVMGALVQQVAR